MFVRDVQHAKQIAILADKAELQIAVHAIGDAAVDAALDMLETIEKTNGKKGSTVSNRTYSTLERRRKYRKFKLENRNRRGAH